MITYLDLGDTRDLVAGDMARALRQATHKALVCKNRDMITGIEFASEAIANTLRLEGSNRTTFLATIKAPKQLTEAQARQLHQEALD